MNIVSNSRSLQSYRQLFSKINVNNTKSKGKAPYKPLLLLSVIDLIADGEIQDRKICITEELIARFKHYRDLLSSNVFTGNLVLPFFHLKNDGFWKLKFSDTYNGGRPQSIPKLRADVDYALLDQQLFELLQTEDVRKQLVDILLEIYFAASDQNIDKIAQINNNFSELELDCINTKNKIVDNNKQYYLKQSIIRNSFFRRSIVQLYEHQCALCKIKVQFNTGHVVQNIVDGAHIKPISLFNDNDLRNGISFCKNHHWAFDNGLFTIDNNYKVIVARNFTEYTPFSREIREFEQEKLLLPKFSNYFPRLDALEWHRDRVFKA